MIEPLVKFVRPIVYFLSPAQRPAAAASTSCWSCCGRCRPGRSSAGPSRASPPCRWPAARRSAWSRRCASPCGASLSYLTAPLFPLVFVFVLLIFMVIFGLVHMIPIVGDIVVGGLFWPMMLIFGLVMAVALVGLVGWPLMSATISTEGTDSWEAVSRSYSYVYQRPWHYVWYSLVAIAYGAVRGLLRRLHGLADGLPGQVGRRPDAAHRQDRPRAVVPVRLRPDLVRLARPAAGRASNGRRPTEGDRPATARSASRGGSRCGTRRRTASAAGTGSTRPRTRPTWSTLSWWQQDRRLPGRVLARPVVPADARLRLQLLLDGQHDHLPAAAQERRCGRAGRGVPGGGGLRGDAPRADAVAPAPVPAPAPPPSRAASLPMVEAPTAADAGPAARCPTPPPEPPSRRRRRSRRRFRRPPAAEDKGGTPPVACTLVRAAARSKRVCALALPAYFVRSSVARAERTSPMPRPVILFSGPWADLPLEELAAQAAEWGYQGSSCAAGAITSRCSAASARTTTRRASSTCCSRLRSERAGRSAPPRQPGGLRRHRRPPPRPAARLRLGRRRPGRACSSGPRRR